MTVLLTLLSNVVVFEIVLAELIVLSHAELKGLHHIFAIIKLVVSDQDFLQTLCNTDASKKSDNTLVHEQVAAEVDLFKG